MREQITQTARTNIPALLRMVARRKPLPIVRQLLDPALSKRYSLAALAASACMPAMFWTSSGGKSCRL